MMTKIHWDRGETRLPLLTRGHVRQASREVCGDQQDRNFPQMCQCYSQPLFRQSQSNETQPKPNRTQSVNCCSIGSVIKHNQTGTSR